MRDDGGLNAYGPVIDNVAVTEDRAPRTLVRELVQTSEKPRPKTRMALTSAW